jgi:tRNA G18 (ribose-2'-O)-methylase SpoU
MVLGKKTADPWSRRVLRVSMGASLRLPIAQADDMLPAIQALQTAKFCCLATVLDDTAVPLTNLWDNASPAAPSPLRRGCKSRSNREQGEGKQQSELMLDLPPKRPPRLAIFFGSEGHGLDAEVVAACDVQATIPMAPGVDSLNVATAAAIFLYELQVGAASRAAP